MEHEELKARFTEHSTNYAHAVVTTVFRAMLADRTSVKIGTIKKRLDPNSWEIEYDFRGASGKVKKMPASGTIPYIEVDWQTLHDLLAGKVTSKTKYVRAVVEEAAPLNQITHFEGKVFITTSRGSTKNNCMVTAGGIWLEKRQWIAADLDNLPYSLEYLYSEEFLHLQRP